jgi:hypothetical protein
MFQSLSIARDSSMVSGQKGQGRDKIAPSDLCRTSALALANRTAESPNVCSFLGACARYCRGTATVRYRDGRVHWINRRERVLDVGTREARYARISSILASSEPGGNTDTDFDAEGEDRSRRAIFRVRVWLTYAILPDSRGCLSRKSRRLSATQRPDPDARSPPPSA